MPMASSADDSIQRQCAACEQEEAQRKESGSGDAGGKAAPGIVSDVLSSGGGQAMDGGTRQFMESRFGHDFGQVRIHTDSRAAESASAIQARAYTSGRDIVFGQGQYQPESDNGKRLLAHELAHVGQQGGGSLMGMIQKDEASPTRSLDRHSDNQWLLTQRCIGDRYFEGLTNDGLVALVAEAETLMTIFTSGVERETLIGNLRSMQTIVRTRQIGQTVAMHLQDVSAATDMATRRTQVLELAEYARANITRIADVEAYLAGTATDEEKMRVLGLLAVQHGRLEFLLGWMYEGGLTDLNTTARTGLNRRGWENDGANAGEFPTHYQDAMHGVQGGDRWCTTFAGYLYNALGLRSNIRQSQAFRSNYRLLRWATSGQNVGSTVVTPAAEQVGAEAGGARLIEDTEWGQLKTNINAATTLEAKRMAVNTFFVGPPEKPMPQAGDIIVYAGVGNALVGGHAHTIMVEYFDPIEFTISTIEGNNEDSAFSRIIDLKDAIHVDKIVALIRLGIQHFNTTSSTAAQPAVPPNQYTLIEPMASVIRRLVEFAADPTRLWICSNDPNATVNNWINGPLCQQPAATTGSTH